MNVSEIYQMSCRFASFVEGSLPVITRTSQLQVNYSGMRPESLDLVRRQRALGLPQASRPIEVNVWPDSGIFLSDGRHRLTAAKELGDSQINALIRYYDDEGYVVDEMLQTLVIDD